MITTASSGSAFRRPSSSDSDSDSSQEAGSPATQSPRLRIAEQSSQAHARAEMGLDQDGSLIDRAAVFHAPKSLSTSPEQVQAQARAQRELLSHQLAKSANHLKVLLAHSTAACGSDVQKMKAFGWALHCEWDEFHDAVRSFKSTGESLVLFAEMLGRATRDHESDDVKCTNLALKVLRSSLDRDWQPGDAAEARESTEVWSRAALAFFEGQSGKRLD